MPKRRTGTERVLAASRRIGDLTMEVRALTYLAVVARRRGEPEAVSCLAGGALELATAGSMPEYMCIAHGNLAWAAWRRRDVDQARIDAEASWAALQRATAVPFFWIGVLPLLAVRTGQGDVAGCMDPAGRLLAPDQMKLPDDLEEPLAGAVEAWEAGDVAAAGDLLRTAVARAEESGGRLALMPRSSSSAGVFVTAFRNRSLLLIETGVAGVQRRRVGHLADALRVGLHARRGRGREPHHRRAARPVHPRSPRTSAPSPTGRAPAGCCSSACSSSGWRWAALAAAMALGRAARARLRRSRRS